MSNIMYRSMGQGLGSWAESEGGDELSACVASDPQPGGFEGPSEFQAKFIELDMGQMQGPQEPLMQALRMLSSTGES